MKRRALLSLRSRLTLIILLPLLAIALAVGAWRIADARKTAADLFDRSLLTTGFAIAADVARSHGNALSIETRDLLADTSGGPVFYHVYAPDGIFVTGYATPPVPLGARPVFDQPITFYDAVYYGRDVRVLRLLDIATIDNVSGTYTHTVWQDVALRDAFVRDLASRTFIVIAVLIGSLTLIVWFGVNIGLRPLLDLEDAISSRSSGDLRPIRRAVPVETRGIVRRLNSLFSQVETAMEAQNTLISNAAHQLRNPIAGVLAMAEAVRNAPTPDAARARSDELVTSARHAADLANKLLTLERIRAAPDAAIEAPVDVGRVVAQAAETEAPRAARAGVEIAVDAGAGPVVVVADEVMLREAVTNLIDNALRHGGPDLSRVRVATEAQNGEASIRVEDDGRGLDAKDVDTVLARFGQAQPGEGSGLGLSIADAVAARHGGRLDLDTQGPGLGVILSLPLAADQRPIA